ncbi:MAG TPA: MBL fold metallo-hydrolase [Gaiellaceae bacterium]
MRVGAFEVTALVDGEGSFSTVGEAFPALDAPEAWLLPVNAVLIRGAGSTVLVDTGLGPEPRAFMPGAGARLLTELARVGSSAAEVDLVVHTHLHVDHVGWDGSFPNARYVVPTDDWSYFMSEESLQQRPHLGDRVEPLGDAGLRARRRRRTSCSSPTRISSTSATTIPACPPRRGSTCWGGSRMQART